RLSVSVPAGTYKIQWINEETVYPVNLDNRATTKLIFSTTSTKMYDAVYLSVFRGDTRIDGGRLHMLEVKASAFAPQPSTQGSNYSPAQARPQAQSSATIQSEVPMTTAAYSSDSGAATVVEQPAQVYTRTVYVEQPVYVSRPVYYAPPPVYVAPVCTTRYVYRAPCAPSYNYCAPVHRIPTYSTYYNRGSCDRSYGGVVLATGSRRGYFGLGFSNAGVSILAGGSRSGVSFNFGTFLK
ncbi:MAG TPA: hypothetical protein VL860_13060, partial [Planctomycetota bacterium]|nr:hypothetical protein [Planctomycetota bacterium]